MKVLIIGNADLVLVKKVIEHTLIPFGDHVSMMSRHNSVFADYYHQNKVKVYQQKKIVTWLGLFNLIYDFWVLFRHYDLICVQNIEDSRVWLARIGRIFSGKLILAFWGSDLLRRKEKSRIVEKGIREASSIVIPTQEMLISFHKLYGEMYDAKIAKVCFGSSGLDTLAGKHYDFMQLREKYKIDPQKVVIAVGYNKAVAQQHLRVLKEISALSDDIKKQIHLLLRLTYGNGDAQYVGKVIEAVVQTGCSNSIYESFLYEEEMAELTSLTDIFLHAQTTDSRSSSMLEHLYAGTLVINPSWIHYSELEGKVFDLKYDRFDELGKMIAENLFRKEESPYRERLQKTNKSYMICGHGAIMSANGGICTCPGKKFE